jgi:uncharacterized protein YbaR (Trm112 family)
MDFQEIKFLLNYLENNPKYLNSVQNKFIASTKENYKSTRVLTKRQLECLYAIKEYIPSLMSKEADYESESDKYPAQYSSCDYLTPFNM